MAVLAISAVGAAVGNALIPGTILGMSGAGIGWAIGGFIGNAFFGPQMPDMEGPRLSGATYTGQTEGKDIPILWGSGRLPGTVIWIDDPVEIKHTESAGGKGGGGGSEYTTYSYLQSFAVCFGEFQSAPPRRIWLNGDLYYDASGDNIEVKSGTLNFVFYPGDTNEVDSLIEQDVGIGNCPSYKGRAVIVIERLNLSENFGNRVPIIEAEFYTDATESSSYTEIGGYTSGSTPYELDQINYVDRNPSDFTLACAVNAESGGDSALYKVDMAAKYSELVKSFDNLFFNSILLVSDYLIGDPDYKPHLYAGMSYSGTGGDFYVFEWPAGRELYHDTDIGVGGGVYLLADGRYKVFAHTGSASANFYFFDKSTWSPGSGTGTGYNWPSGDWLTACCIDYEEDVFAVVARDSTDNHYRLYTFDTVSGVTQSSERLFTDAGYTDSDFTSDASPMFYDRDNGRLFFAVSKGSADPCIAVLNTSGELLQLFDLVADYGVTNTATFDTQGYPRLNFEPHSRTIWFNLNGHGTGKLNVDGFRLYVDYVEMPSAFAAYYPNRNSVWSALISSDTLYFREYAIAELDTGTVAVADIVSDLCARVGLTASEIDVTDLSGLTVGGFMHAGRNAVRSDIEVLLSAVHADGVQSDWKLKFIQRGGAIADTIDADDMAAHEENVGEAVDQLSIQIPMQTEVPQTLEIEYMSSDNLFQPAIQQSYWQTGTSEAKQSLRLPLVLSDQEAADLIEIQHQQMMDPKVYQFSLSQKYGHLEPTDPITLTVGDNTVRARLVRMDRGVNGVFSCEAIADYASHYASTAVSPGVDEFVGTIATELVPTQLILDTPLLRDTDFSHPGPYLTSFVPSSSYTTSIWHYSFDNSNFAAIAAQTAQPTVGIVDTARNGATWEDWDDDTTIRVRILNGGTLSSSTKSAIESDGTINAVAYGDVGRWEVLNFATATLVSTGVYDLTNLLRGRRGTDNFIADHEARDYLVVLSETGITRQTLQNAQIGNTEYLRLPITGMPVVDASTVEWEVGENPLKPWSPIQVVGTLHASLKIDVAWTRRTRFGGSLGGDNTLTDGVGGDLNESTEAYEIDVVNAYTDQVLNTTAYTATTNAYEHTVAQQTSDGSLNLGLIYYDIYQMSAVAGRGFRGRGTFDRGWGDVINAMIGLGAELVFPLSDADGSTAIEYLSGDTTSTYTSGSQDSALSGDGQYSMNLDGSSYVTFNRLIKDALAGNNKASIVVWGSGYVSNEPILIASQGDSTAMVELRHAAGGWQVTWNPKAGAGVTQTNGGSIYEMQGVSWMVASTLDLTEGTFGTVRAYTNEQQTGSGTCSGNYASTLETQTNNASYLDRCGANMDASTIASTGSRGLVGVFPGVELTAAQVASIRATARTAYDALVESHGGIALFKLDQYVDTFATPETDVIGSNVLDTASGLEGWRSCVHIGTNNAMYASAVTEYLLGDLPSAWKLQDITIELWFVATSAVGTNAPILSLLPRNAYSDGRGMQLRVDSTNGLRGRVGNGSGWTEIDAATANVSTNTPYLCTLTCSSTAGLVLYLNGSAIANNGGTPVTIEWDDGSSNGPVPATVLVNRAIQTNASQSPDVNGVAGRFNSFAVYNKASSAAEVLARYNYGAGVVS